MNLKSTFCLLEHGHLGTGGGDKDRKRLKSSARLGARATRRGKIELAEAGDQSSVPNNIHFLKCLSTFPARNEREGRVEKWKGGEINQSGI